MGQAEEDGPSLVRKLNKLPLFPWFYSSHSALGAVSSLPVESNVSFLCEGSKSRCQPFLLVRAGHFKGRSEDYSAGGFSGWEIKACGALPHGRIVSSRTVKHLSSTPCFVSPAYSHAKPSLMLSCQLFNCAANLSSSPLSRSPCSDTILSTLTVRRSVNCLRTIVSVLTHLGKSRPIGCCGLLGYGWAGAL